MFFFLLVLNSKLDELKKKFNDSKEKMSKKRRANYKPDGGKTVVMIFM